MNVTLRQLRAFAGICRTRSITRAARELGITQSAASLLIQQLETQLGVKLFDRSTRSVQPTLAANEAFLAAERMLGDALGLSRRMGDGADGAGGAIRAGVDDIRLILRGFLEAVLLWRRGRDSNPR